MKRLIESLRTMDANQRNYWLGLLLLFSGLTWYISVFLALTVIGAVMIIESVITSYIAALINSRNMKDTQ